MQKISFSSVGYRHFSRWMLVSDVSGINVHRRKHQYPANGMSAHGISGVFPLRLVCKDFAIALSMP